MAFCSGTAILKILFKLNLKLKDMKKITVILSIALLSVVSVYAQKYAFVDTEYILNNIPSYKAAQDEIDKLSVQYEAEVLGVYNICLLMIPSFVIIWRV